MVTQTFKIVNGKVIMTSAEGIVTTYEKGKVVSSVPPPPPPQKPLEQIIAEKKLSGVLQVAGAPPVVYKFKEEPKQAIVAKVEGKKVTLPISKGVAEKITKAGGLEEIYRQQQIMRMQREQVREIPKLIGKERGERAALYFISPTLYEYAKEHPELTTEQLKEIHKRTMQPAPQVAFWAGKVVTFQTVAATTGLLYGKEAVEEKLIGMGKLYRKEQYEIQRKLGLGARGQVFWEKTWELAPTAVLAGVTAGIGVGLGVAVGAEAIVPPTAKIVGATLKVGFGTFAVAGGGITLSREELWRKLETGTQEEKARARIALGGATFAVAAGTVIAATGVKGVLGIHGEKIIVQPPKGEGEPYTYHRGIYAHPLERGKVYPLVGIGGGKVHIGSVPSFPTFMPEGTQIISTGTGALLKEMFLRSEDVPEIWKQIAVERLRIGTELQFKKIEAIRDKISRETPRILTEEEVGAFVEWGKVYTEKGEVRFIYGSKSLEPFFKKPIEKILGREIHDIDWQLLTGEKGGEAARTDLVRMLSEASGGRFRVSPTESVVVEKFVGKQWVKAGDIHDLMSGLEGASGGVFGVTYYDLSKIVEDIPHMTVGSTEIRKVGAGMIPTFKEGEWVLSSEFAKPATVKHIFDPIAIGREVGYPTKRLISLYEKAGVVVEVPDISQVSPILVSPDVSRIAVPLSVFIPPSMVVSPPPSVPPSVSVSPAVSKSISMSVSPSISPSVSISVLPSVSPSVSASVSPSVSPSVSVSVSPSVSPSVSRSVSPSVSPSLSASVSPSPSPSVSPYPSPSISLLLPSLPLPSKKVYKRKKPRLMYAKGFVTEIFKGGKWVRVSKKALPRQKAIKLGERYVDVLSLAARFRIKPTRETVMGLEKPYIPSKKFRGYRIRKGERIPLKDEWIEEARFRLEPKGKTFELPKIMEAKRQRNVGKPSMVRFYPSGRRRRRFRTVPSSLFAQQRRPQKVKRIRKKTVKLPFTKSIGMIGMSFPSAEKAMQSVMPIFKKRGKKRK